MSQETTFTKGQLASTLAILLDLNQSQEKDLSNLQKETLQAMYDNYIVNARQANQRACKSNSTTCARKNTGTNR